MNAENLSLDFMKNQLFGEFIAQDGLTEIAVNRPGELHTKILGKWRRHEAPVTLRQCYAFARALASWQDDNIDDTSPILSATLESGERIQAIIPPACERNTVSITLRMAAMRPCAGKHAFLLETACASSCGLDALMICRMGVMSRLDAAPKPPKVNGGTPSPATRDHPL